MRTKAKIILHLLLLTVIWTAMVQYETTVYLYFQAKGQLGILASKQSFEEYRASSGLSKTQLDNLKLIEDVKKYSVDSLAYLPTKNFTEIFDQKDKTILWAITASEKYKVKPFYWTFPVVGEVSYKGFFIKEKAVAEKNRLMSRGYDVDMRGVSAWSTLGWFSDPVLSGMLDRRKGSLCNLIFHELFHATYYAKSSVDFNENLASFIAHKATLRYLENDTAELRYYRDTYNDNLIIDSVVAGELDELKKFYEGIKDLPEGQKSILKLKKLHGISQNLGQLRLSNMNKVKGIQSRIMEDKNAWFVDFRQYSGLQDSLEGVFNKIYKSDLRLMVQSLK